MRVSSCSSVYVEVVGEEEVRALLDLARVSAIWRDGGIGRARVGVRKTVSLGGEGHGRREIRPRARRELKLRRGGYVIVWTLLRSGFDRRRPDDMMRRRAFGGARSGAVRGTPACGKLT